MANPGVGNTALGAAVCRLIEQYQPEPTRLFHDPLVEDLVGSLLQTLMRLKGMRDLAIQQMDAITPGIYGVQIARTRFIDDAVQEAISRGIRQVVLLGAGLDTRPYRLAGIEHTSVFEVDLPSVQENKKQKLQKHLEQLPQHVTFLPIDFDTQSLEAIFSGTSFDATSPVIFVWEGVTQYLAEEAVHRTLAFVGTAAPGSLLVFTYIMKSLIERRSTIPGASKMMDRVARQSAPWQFGLEPSSVSADLSPFHLHLVADVGHTEHQARYFKPIDREIIVSEIERIVQATVVRP